jgi:competence protein ComEC
MRGVAVTELRHALEHDHPLRAAAVHAVRCEAGQAWSWDGVRFRVLHPPASAYGRGAAANALSCVLRVEGDAGAALLTGDIGREQEAWLVAQDPGRLRAHVLLAPHHGSRTSSSAPFLDAVRPRVAVVQSGYRNRFGHPAPVVLARYAERGIAVVASPACGAWRWSGDAAAPGVCLREAARRYWHHRPAVSAP